MEPVSASRSPWTNRTGADRIARGSLAAIAAFAVACSSFTTWHPHLLHTDDSYFYYEVALHLAHGDGSRFHSFSSTNGFHPLWEAVCTTLVVLGADRASLPYIAVALANAMSCASLALVAWALRANGVRNVAIGLGAFAAYAFFTTMGLEGQLLAFLLSMALFVVRAPEPSLARNFAFHTILAFAVLARLDAIFVCGCLSIARIAAPSRHRLFDHLLVASTPYLILVGGYVAWNAMAFGHPVPISGRIKTSVTGRGIPDIAAAAGVVTIVSAIVVGRLSRASFLRQTCLALGAGVALHAGLLSTVLHGGGQIWYYFSWYIVLAFVAPVALHATDRTLRAKGFRSLAVALGIGSSLLGGAIPFLFVASHRPRIGLDGLTTIVSQIDRARLPEGTSIFVYDLPGAMGYLAGLDVVPADGLMSDATYDELVAAEGIERYLASRGIRFFMGRGPIVSRGEPKDHCSTPSLYNGSTLFRCRAIDERRYRVVSAAIRTPLSGRFVGDLVLGEDAVVDTFEFDGRSYAVWRLDSPTPP